jgi:hypothetical protein
MPEELLGVQGLATRQVLLLIYSSERFNTWVTQTFANGFGEILRCNEI